MIIREAKTKKLFIITLLTLLVLTGCGKSKYVADTYVLQTVSVGSTNGKVIINY